MTLAANESANQIFIDFQHIPGDAIYVWDDMEHKTPRSFTVEEYGDWASAKAAAWACARKWQRDLGCGIHTN
jgi:hypothetical protein